jgi:hypothetical protein
MVPPAPPDPPANGVPRWGRKGGGGGPYRRVLEPPSIIIGFHRPPGDSTGCQAPNSHTIHDSSQVISYLKILLLLIHP